MRRALPVWRSMLFVPATNDKLVESATRRNADAFQIDLEDAVSIDRKAEAREKVQSIAAQLGKGGGDVLVRINRPWRLAVRDVEASVGENVLALNLPKVPDATYVREIDALVTELEQERGLTVGHTGFMLMVETAQGVLNMAEIAAASSRNMGITIGAEDLSLDMGMQPSEESLLVPNMQLMAAARAAGILPIGYLASVANFSDLGAFRSVVRRSSALGFRGGFCIHPNQIDILNEEFCPSTEQVADAEELVDAYDQALREGKGAMTFKDKMIDQPVAERAREIVSRHKSIMARVEGKALKQPASN